MKQSVWGYAALVLGVTAIMMTWFFTQTTNTDQHNYNLLKETVENAMYDALDLSYYRAYSKLTEEEKLELSEKGEYAPLRIDEQKFIESFLRRFAENADLSNTYRIDIYDILETPPKVSLKVTTIKDASGATASGGDVMNFSIVNNIDAILEARWQGEFAEEYTVTFNKNDGTGSIEIGVEEGDPIPFNQVTVKEKEGIIFNGEWMCNGKKASKTNNMPVMSDMTCDAIVEAKKVTVTFDINYDITGTGYEKTATQTFTYGKQNQKFGYEDGKIKWYNNVGQFGLWDRTNYKLLGWSTNKNAQTATYAPYCNVIDSWIASNSPSVTLYAIWQYDPAKYIISYNANGGSGGPTSQIKTHGVNLILSSSTPTRTPGYTFNGWNTTSRGSGTSYASGATYTANSGTILYAQWSPKKVTVTYNINYDTTGTGYSPTASQEFIYGKTNQKFGYENGSPKWAQTGQFGLWNRTGHTLLGWSTNKNAQTATYERYCGVTDSWIASNSPSVTLYAIWKSSLTIVPHTTYNPSTCWQFACKKFPSCYDYLTDLYVCTSNSASTCVRATESICSKSIGSTYRYFAYYG